MKGQWTKVYSGDFPLRSWWVDSGSDCKYISTVSAIKFRSRDMKGSLQT